MIKKNRMRRKTFLILFLICSCSLQTETEKGLPAVHTYLNYLKDTYGRYIYIHGINVSGSDKFPVNDEPCMTDPKKACTFNTTRIIPNYVGKPFPLEDADKHFEQIRALGFNTIRLNLMWEGVQPLSPYDVNEEYIDYIGSIVEKANEHGIYVLLDMHQDIFSRHLLVYFSDFFKGNEETLISILKNYIGEKAAGMAPMLASLLPIPFYNNAVRGDGAPRWAVEAVLYEKNLDSPVWGFPRFLGNIIDPSFLESATRVLSWFTGMSVEFPPEITTLFPSLFPKYPYDITETTDLLPWTTWGINAILSLDIQRCFAAFFAGRDVFPELNVDGKNIQDYLQDAYRDAWAEIAKRVKDYPNVIGYDIINEPIGFFLTLTLAAAFFQIGSVEGVKNFLSTLLNVPEYPNLATDIVNLLQGLYLLPPDTKQSTREKWGFKYADLFGILGINYGFDDLYLRPFYEKVGKAILSHDPDAIIWVEPSLGIETVISTFAGGEPPFQISMTKPAGIPQVVYAPHWYPDIYPFPGFAMPPREFTPEEVKFRDYVPGFKGAVLRASHSLGNIPVVVGEFGTYFNFNGIDRSERDDYIVSKEIMDNEYEALESLFLSHIQWCWSPENTPERGEGWNGEDFSVIDILRKPRGATAYSRPHPTFISGKPLHIHFYSPHHYFDPDKGIVNPEREFVLKFESKESDMPTVIFIPYEIHYPDGFYVFLSDGYAIYKHQKSKSENIPSYGFLYYYPASDEPGHVHAIKILPPLEGNEIDGWNYFFKEDTVVTGKGGGWKE